MEVTRHQPRVAAESARWCEPPWEGTTCEYKVSGCAEAALELSQIEEIIVESGTLCIDDSITVCSIKDTGRLTKRLIDRSARYPSFCNASADWLRGLTPDLSRPMSEGLFCFLQAVEQNGGQYREVCVDVFDTCFQGNCTCIFNVSGAIAQLKPCRMYAEAICMGDKDPDWDYMLRGAILGFHVIDPYCVSSYFQNNYSSITKGGTGEEMSARVRAEIDVSLLCVVDKPCVYIPLGQFLRVMMIFR